jgi:tRNA/tmRNA/rRNA uracil-C5-methylase (TrmA/RlmC/RlmD family)
VNTAVLEKMIDFCGNIPDSGGCLVDVYCGTGVLGICLSASFARVTGIDNSQAAIENARINAKLNGADNCKFCCGDATELIKEVLQTETEVSLIFDPPRKGLTPEIIECVSASNIRRIIYISCNPATQVRDLKKLVEAGYMIWAVQAFDMFPQTWHIENAVIMEKR